MSSIRSFPFFLPHLPSPCSNPTPLKALAFTTACHSPNFSDPSAFDIIRRYPHPKFNRFTLFADVAVVHVDRNMDQAGDVVPIPLIDRPVAQDEAVKVFGWNFDFLVEMETQDLCGANTKTLDPMNCVHHYGPRFLAGEMLCVDGWSFVNKSFVGSGCEMDPGGPATLTQDKTRFLVGLSSFSGGCLYKGWPAVFQDTFRYREWIRERMFSGEEEE